MDRTPENREAVVGYLHKAFLDAEVDFYDPGDLSGTVFRVRHPRQQPVTLRIAMEPLEDADPSSLLGELERAHVIERMRARESIRLPEE